MSIEKQPHLNTSLSAALNIHQDSESLGSTIREVTRSVFHPEATLPLIPRNSLLKLDRAASKDIQRATNSQINTTTTQLLHQLQVL